MDGTSGETGHLFVVHGRIESIAHDAALVPVSQQYAFSSAWTDLVGERPPLPLAWTERGYGRIKPAPDRVWAVSLGGRSGDDYERILDRVAGALARIDLRRDARKPVRGKGALPLVAVPVIGIGLGGHSEDRGTVLRMLVERLTREAQRLRLDIVLVTPEPAVYAAAQYARRKLTEPLPGRLEDVAKDLARHARSGHLALLLGAGVSAAAGLPKWSELISQLARESGVPDPDPGSGLTPTDQAELIERVDRDGFQERVAKIIGNDRRPSLPHALLAGLDCHEIVTTNYDLLYERAVEATGRGIASVMPWASAHGADRWILKLHGDVKHPEGIVLTRRHMVRYDAANRPSAAILQSLLLTKRLLAVGVSMTDDNVIRLAHEVDAYRHEHQDDPTETFGTVLDAGGHELRRQLWEGQLDWINVPQQMGCAGPRGVELFLDRIAFHASRDSSWLLDERFEGLLDDRRDREIAQRVRELYRGLPQRDGSKWAPLARQIEQLGVRSGQ